MNEPFHWSNWSGSVDCNPREIHNPTSEAELQRLILDAGKAGKRLRVTGSGHSFVPLCASDECLLSLDGLQGLISTSPDLENLGDKIIQATFWAGSKIHQMGDPLWQFGGAMANMGDIDRQALAGAIATGTHGTGRRLGNISSQVSELRIVLASGEIVECSPSNEAELFKAAQVSLGLLGVLSQVTLKTLPAYHLHERTWVADFEECCADLEAHIKNNRHFEFFWSPGEDACAMKTLNPVVLSDVEATQLPIRRGVKGEVEGRMARYVREEQIDRSYRVFPSERNLKFNEMEFALPYSHGVDCLREIRQLMQRKYPQVLWPIEYRTLAADDIWLSPAYDRESVTISIHQAADLDQRAFFADAEAIFHNHHGRPHWGKMHGLKGEELGAIYPQWDRFLLLRRQLDPKGMLLNDYLRTMFE